MQLNKFRFLLGYFKKHEGENNREALCENQMDGGGEGSGIRLSKRFAGGKVTGTSLEVDYKTKSGTAWSHSFLNQKPWHPLSYPNQRRKWIAEQTNAQHDRRAEEVAREVRAS